MVTALAIGRPGTAALAWAAPPARRLRTIGWTLIAVSTATAGMAIALLRR
jgi:hypothetical protein